MPEALLVLADGNVYPGVSVGAEGHADGEVVFNTSMTGYQEMLTDPSETATALRQASPFSFAIDPRTRQRILRETVRRCRPRRHSTRTTTPTARF